MAYKEKQQKKHEKLISDSFFEGDKGNGIYKNKPRPFVLKDGSKNLYASIRDEALVYFRENNVGWWMGKNPTGHTLSSQIACLNHLMPIRKDKDTVLRLINGVYDDKFKAVLPMKCDKAPGYVAFEVVSKEEHLNEGKLTRGSQCTSIDAAILAQDNDDKKCLIIIEWKYTEAENGNEDKPKRRAKYDELIEKSKYLLSDNKSTVYYCKPFYQLMRQTLWAEQIIENKEKEYIQADYFLHIHVIPKANEVLRKKNGDVA